MSSDRSTVYVVDDDSRIREALSALLSSVGYDVMTFSSAGEYLAFQRPDVSACLVLDLDLPGMNGLELQKQLADAGGPPIVFLTDYEEDGSTVSRGSCKDGCEIRYSLSRLLIQNDNWQLTKVLLLSDCQ